MLRDKTEPSIVDSDQAMGGGNPDSQVTGVKPMGVC